MTAPGAFTSGSSTWAKVDTSPATLPSGGIRWVHGPHSQAIACSTIHWDGLNTLTVTLGKANDAQLIRTAPSVATYTPDPALGVSGVITSVKEENF